MARKRKSQERRTGKSRKSSQPEAEVQSLPPIPDRRAAGRREEEVGHFQQVLRLNPNDNQGIRYA